jgi:hypothetical protein
MAAPVPCPQLLAPPPGSGGGGPAIRVLTGLGMLMFHGDVFLGEVEVFSTKKGPEGSLHRVEDHETGGDEDGFRLSRGRSESWHRPKAREG